MKSLLYEHIGFEYHSIDLSGEDNCIVIDLNHDDIPKNKKNTFDLVTNIGTTEHIFNQSNCFKAIHDATTKNGVMIHALPMNNSLEHGLFNYQPNLFFSLALSNKYEIIDFCISQSTKAKHTYRNNDSIDYEIDMIDNYDALNPSLDTGLFIAFRKTSNNNFIIPQQNIYSATPYTQDKIRTPILDDLHELSLWCINKNEILSRFAGKNMVLYGAGGITKNILSIKDIRKHVIAIADYDKKKQGLTIEGIEIIPPNRIPEFSTNIFITIDIDIQSLSILLKKETKIDLNITFLNT